MEIRLVLAIFALLSSVFGESRKCPLNAQFVVVDDVHRSERADDASRLPTLVVRNISAAAVIGFVVSVNFVDPRTGSVVSYRITEALRETPEGKRIPLPPGASVTLRRTTAVTLTRGGLADPKVTFDLVLWVSLGPRVFAPKHGVVSKGKGEVAALALPTARFGTPRGNI